MRVSEGARCERERMKDIVQSTEGETEGKRERERFCLDRVFDFASSK